MIGRAIGRIKTRAAIKPTMPNMIWKILAARCVQWVDCDGLFIMIPP